MQPDIEIYIKHLEIASLIDWLQKHFDHVPCKQLAEVDLSVHKPFSTIVQKGETTIDIMITPCAAGKAYTSIWFKSNATDWENDLACAESFLQEIDTEVRCSAESWQEEEPEFSEKWWKMTRSGRDLVAWS